ncbi:hypothetical protein LXA43DRAFT_1061457 [Ganoderma leucocontextum]|nr:hypothetical protein LXA43DRAFT_1061457 [Ganoderma leucocontextum]
MSFTEHPSAPRAPPPLAEASEVNDDNRGQSSAAMSSSTKAIEEHEVVQDKSICDDFLHTHVRAAPVSFTFTEKMNADVAKICKAGTSEWKMYKPAASLLTAISKGVYETLDKTLKREHVERQQIREKQPEYLTFIDHHSTTPTHFPNDALSHAKDAPALSHAKDAPDLLGVYDVDIFKYNKDADGVYKQVPHHRVEAIVEAKSERNGGGRRQATTYAYRHHQARPDRPGFYVLVIKPQWYQVLYSDPTGVFASPETPWKNMGLLVAYLYSHYYPPDGHFLWDDTIWWSEPEDGPCPFPSWKVRFDGKMYENCRLIFIGEPWTRLTNVFETEDANGKSMIIKDYYRQRGRRFKEEEILTQIHGEGDLLGVVRLKGHESVKRLEFVLKGAGTERSRERFAFLDTGSRLLKAKTLNDLLKAIYDALEVHRTQLLQRKVLHRDMSIYNILMYPEWTSMEGRHVNKNSPLMIDDVLAERPRPVEGRFPRCLSIDYDNAAVLDRDITGPTGKDQDLTRRTGTPAYVARSVCIGRVLNRFGCNSIPAMPKLSGKALELYDAVHGKRYHRYNDKDKDETSHGAPPQIPHPTKVQTPPHFFHRAEHDVESIYWSMISAVLRVRPQGIVEDSPMTHDVGEVWMPLLTHRVPARPDTYTDPRQPLMDKSSEEWRAYFLDGMKDVGDLLEQISQQVNPEYALWGDRRQPDHLHEAMQRLIFQYIIDHEDVSLDPNNLRPIPAVRIATATWPSLHVSTIGPGPDLGNASAGGSAAAVVAAEPTRKRKTSPQAGPSRRSKRLKEKSGAS